MRGELFKGVKQWDVNHKGEDWKLPVFYYDNTSMTAIYTASTRAIKKVLPTKRMTPIELVPGRCLVAFTAFEYRETDINPYNEFSISILVTMDSPQIPGVTISSQFLKRTFTAYVWHLPVTTEIARDGGVDLYGYPKFIANIDFTRTDKRVDCRLSENGDHILTLSGKKIPTSKGQQLRFITYSIKDDIPLVANVYTNPMQFAQSPIGNSASLEIGDSHPICSELKKIDLSKNPIVYQFSPENEAILFAGRNLIDN